MSKQGEENPKKSKAHIDPPNMKQAKFRLIGDSPLVIRRFSQKTKQEMLEKMMRGPDKLKQKKVHEKLDVEAAFNGARYIAPAGWDGFNAASIRAAMISACRLVNFKMTIAKLSVFVIPDGWDKFEPQIPLVRIYGKPEMLQTIARVETGQPYVVIRPCYQTWEAHPLIEYDADQFTLDDVANLLNRMGKQVGLCEGRPDSKDSAGQGWGTFHVAKPGEGGAK